MTVSLRAELERRIEAKINSGEYASVEALVEEAVERLIVEDEAELEGIGAALDESRSQSARGETSALEEFDQQFRAKYGLHR